MNTFFKWFLAYLLICVVVVGYRVWCVWTQRRDYLKKVDARLNEFDNIVFERHLTNDEVTELMLLRAELEGYESW